MSVDTLYDSNILVYAYDKSEGKKHLLCQQLVAGVFSGEHTGIVTNQVLAETYHVLTRDMKLGMDPDTARKTILDFILSNKWTKINYTHETLSRAMIASSVHGVPFWDSLIAETAKENGITTILTENDADFKRISGIRAINPFKQ